MEILFLVFIPPFLWALTQFIDKFLITSFFEKKFGVLMLISTLIGLIVAPIIAFFQPSVLSVDPFVAILLMLNGSLMILYLIPYFIALKTQDASTISPMFLMIPIMIMFLAFFALGENLTVLQLLASLLVIGGSAGIMLHFSKGGFTFDARTFGLMALSSLLVAVNFVFFKFFALQFDFVTVSFWEYAGFGLIGIFLYIFLKKDRIEMLKFMRKKGFWAVMINFLNEALNIVALVIFTFVSLSAPVAIVSALNSVQAVFVLIIGIFLTRFFPKYIKEDISRNRVIQKAFFIGVIIVGVMMLNSTL
ncbi:MAG: EamA family transporter [archaeon]